MAKKFKYNTGRCKQLDYIKAKLEETEILKNFLSLLNNDGYIEHAKIVDPVHKEHYFTIYAGHLVSGSFSINIIHRSIPHEDTGIDVIHITNDITNDSKDKVIKTYYTICSHPYTGKDSYAMSAEEYEAAVNKIDPEWWSMTSSKMDWNWFKNAIQIEIIKRI